LLASNQEELLKAYIATFSCEKENDGIKISLNPDIEGFLNNNAIQFARMKIGVTYLVVDEDDGALLAYYSLAHKPLEIPADGISRKIRDKVKRFSAIDEENNSYQVSAFLIGQFGKNYAVDNGSRIFRQAGHGACNGKASLGAEHYWWDNRLSRLRGQRRTNTVL
jgi:hypothetical protein